MIVTVTETTTRTNIIINLIIVIIAFRGRIIIDPMLQAEDFDIKTQAVSMKALPPLILGFRV